MMDGWKLEAIGPYRNPDCNTPATSRCARHKGKECARTVGWMPLPKLPQFHKTAEESSQKLVSKD